MTELSIVPECYVDTKIAEIVGQATRKYNHQHGRGDVANQLRNRLGNKIALGIVDEDKGKGPAPKYFSEFNLVAAENSLILKRHAQRKQYLILICPEVEQWLMNDAMRVGINPEDYKLPSALEGFKALTKVQDIDRNNHFKDFIKALLRAQSPSISTLKKWIEWFKEDRIDKMTKQ